MAALASFEGRSHHQVGLLCVLLLAGTLNLFPFTRSQALASPVLSQPTVTTTSQDFFKLGNPNSQGQGKSFVRPAMLPPVPASSQAVKPQTLSPSTEPATMKTMTYQLDSSFLLKQPLTIRYHYKPQEITNLDLDVKHILLSWPEALVAARAAKQSTTDLVVPMKNDPVAHTLTAQATLVAGVATVSGDPENQAPPNRTWLRWKAIPDNCPIPTPSPSPLVQVALLLNSN